MFLIMKYNVPPKLKIPPPRGLTPAFLGSRTRLHMTLRTLFLYFHSTTNIYIHYVYSIAYDIYNVYYTIYIIYALYNYVYF